MQPNDPETLRQRALATLRVLEDAIQAGTLTPIELAVATETDAKTGLPTGQQTITLTTRPAAR